MTKTSSKLNRRQLLKGAGMATVSAAFWYPSGRVLGANDRVNLAIVGIRGQGTSHIDGFGKMKDVNIAAFCDIDENLYGSRTKRLQDVSKTNATPKTYWDIKKLLEDKDIQAVTLAVPNFWHALAAIWSAQAGKHVYVEKPACQYVWEGRQMVNAARKHKVLMEVGFQNRSRKNTTAAIKFLQEGKLGKIYRARGLCFKRRGNIGRYPDGPMAEGVKFVSATPAGQPPMDGFTKSYLEKVHYDHWIGPTSVRPFNPNRFHYNWHWQWEYGGGDTANQGPHQFDVARWGLGKDEYPVKVRSFGGLFAYQDSAQETPNEQTTLFEYADGTVFEFGTRGLPTNAEGMHKRFDSKGKEVGTGILIGNIFYGEKGRLEIDDAGNWTAFDDKNEVIADSKNIKEEASDATVTTGSGSGGHYTNFIEAVKANKQELLTCDIEQGFRSSVLPAIANISYRVGRELKFDGKKEQFVGDAQANKLLKRPDRKGFVVPNLGGTSA
jgi:predicted dehydrogenase